MSSFPVVLEVVSVHGRRVDRHHTVIPSQDSAEQAGTAYSEAAGGHLLGLVGRYSVSWYSQLHRYVMRRPLAISSHLTRIETVNKYGQRAAIVQTGWKTQLVCSALGHHIQQIHLTLNRSWL